MISAAILSNDVNQLSNIRDMVLEYASLRKINADAEAYTVYQALLDEAELHPFDIYIIDQATDGISCIEIARVLRDMNDKGLVIFTADSADYAPASYEVDALYYMVKPLDKNLMFSVLDRAVRRLSPKAASFKVRTAYGCALVRVGNLLYAEAVERKPVYHLTKGRTVIGLVLRGSFNSATVGLFCSGYFAYLGPSKIVNLKFVEEVNRENVRLADGTVLQASKAACSSFRRAWEAYYQG